MAKYPRQCWSIFGLWFTPAFCIGFSKEFYFEFKAKWNHSYWLSIGWFKIGYHPFIYSRFK